MLRVDQPADSGGPPRVQIALLSKSCGQFAERPGNASDSVIIAKHLARAIDEVNSAAGRASQRDVCQAIVGRGVIVKPRLHVLACCGALVDYGSHV